MMSTSVSTAVGAGTSAILDSADMSTSDLWGEFPRDPRSTENAHLRAADVDRDLVHRVLAEAFADGRLDRQEFDERSERVVAIRTLGQLPDVVADLVPLQPAATAPALLTPDALRERAVADWRSDRREAVWGLFAVSAIVWVIWAVTGAGFPWPLFVTLAATLNLGRIQFLREERILEEQRRLERKQRKALEARRRESTTEPEDEK